ncbi:uncharacterized protein LOC129584288 [Paramacrobiotus metropolitanus]|uniref:uncharacterized protein LOC129584288 n=1 Tax=Paramacrobiotus metropolitanus TaxID=2943436 RepID=UPI0024460437|nr:uncharacterized protein LOC129584288 [Paramacrobiotus metropolitanus]
MPGKKCHVLLLSFPAFGHIIPILELARKVAKHHTVTLALSESKIAEMMKKEIFSNESTENIKLLPIKDKAVGDFDNPDNHKAAFEIVFTSIMPSAQHLLATIPRPDGTGDRELWDCQPVDVVIADNFLAGPLQTCRERGIPFYCFNTAALWLTRYFALMKDDAPIIAMEEVDPFHTLPGPNDPPLAFAAPFLKFFGTVRKIWPYAQGMIHNSFEAFDKDELELLRRHPDMQHLSHFLVGPLLPESAGKVSDTDLALSEKVKNWLAKQEPREVVYVSFGTMAVPVPEQITQLANALISLNKPFIWSLRETKHQFLPEDIREKISGQFENSSRFLILNWAPQKMILADPAIAAVVTHGGWNSTLETLTNGLPLVCWPMFADQLVNARWLVKAGAAEMLEGTGMKPKRVVPAQEIADIIVKVSGHASGEPYRTAAKQWQKEIAAAIGSGGSSSNDIARLCAFKEVQG